VKLLLFLLAVAVVWFALRSRFRRERPPVRKSGTKAIDAVRCSHCGTHLPRDEALYRDARYFCSRAHLEQGSDSDR
jgi:uncharacterized protein